MSDITYKEIVDYLRESTGDANWYLNNKIGLPVAHRYMNAVSVRNRVTEAAKVLRKKKEEEHAGHLKYAIGKTLEKDPKATHVTLGGKKIPIKDKQMLEAMCNECGMAETKCACMRKEDAHYVIKHDDHGYEVVVGKHSPEHGFIPNPGRPELGLKPSKDIPPGTIKTKVKVGPIKLHPVQEKYIRFQKEKFENINEDNDKWYEKIDNAPTHEHAIKVIRKTPLKHLHKFEFWNGGLSGVREHPYMEHVKDEIRRRYENMDEETINMYEDSAAERDHTHAAHFHDHKGNWSGMALITAKSDEDAVKQAHELAQSDRYKDFKLAHVEKHTPVKDLDEVLDPSMGASKYIHDFVHSDNPKFHGKSKKERIRMALGAYYGAKKEMKEATVISSEEELNEILGESFFLSEDKAERTAKAREVAINNIKLGKGSVAMRKRLAAMHGVHHITGEPLSSGGGETSKHDDEHDDDDYYMHRGNKYTAAEVDKVKKSFKRRKLSTKSALDMLHNARKAASAKHATSGVGGGGTGARNVSPLDTAISRVKEKPAKGAGASPAELDAAKAEKKAAEKKKPSDTTKRLTGKIEEGLGDFMTGAMAIAKTRAKLGIQRAFIPPKLHQNIKDIQRIHDIGKRLNRRPVREELNTDMVDKQKKDKVKKIPQKSKVRKKYENKKMTMTGETAHKVEINPEIGNVKV
jgi:hypothetical protein